MTYDLRCSGPGPHDPVDGILGTADRPIDGMRCNSPACSPSLEKSSVDVAQPNVTADPAALEAATAKVLAATTVAGLRAAMVQALNALSTD